ncbi:hypothetical protein K402DRAFT_218482 [Aulographum hederae CBS 113979]|uniref:Uncharacterized protein n=1 Tax=Aulographum hederae CBS 113979 TaxID=1176131 RepID=A0A6G1GLL8_9PEZI|nr:hypothetical protein K402DRAFT_218482 [Aulographum hederae CBS 113979]
MSFPSIFTVNCTLPPPGLDYRYVSGPNTRGTLDILWSCLSVLFLCTWSVLHLNVPVQSVPSGWKQKCAKSLYLFTRKLLWVLLAIMFPEIVFGKAVNDYFAAKTHLAHFKEKAKKDGVEWSLVHSYYADMGGFIIDFTSCSDLDTQFDPMHDENSSWSHMNFWSCEFSVRGLEKYIGKIQWEADPVHWEQLVTFQTAETEIFEKAQCQMLGTLWILDANQIKVARRRRIITRLPEISEAEINDMNKGDVVVKALALFQIARLILDLSTRAYKHLPFSLLELVALAFAVCSICTYLLYLDKPQDVHTARSIPAARHPSRSELQELMEAAPHAYLRATGTTSMRNEAIHKVAGTGRQYHFELGCAAGSTLFGCVCALGWNSFANAFQEGLLRIIAIASIMAFPVWAAVWWFDVRAPQTRTGKFILRWLPLAFVAILYGMGRFWLWLSIFTELSRLPPGVFISTWTSSIPHIG